MGEGEVQYGREKEWVDSKTGLRREIGDAEEDKRRRRKITGEKERNVMEKKDR